MIDGARLSERMRLQGLSQSELARRVGVTQQTIYKLISGTSRSSGHLHKIARELETTPAYLTGEVADPDADAPPAPEFTHEERELVECFRALTLEDYSALTQLAHSLSGRSRPRTAITPREIELPPENALAQMFEALLRVTDREAPLGEQAQLLARRLPIGLAQLRDLIPAPDRPANAKPRSPRPTPVREPQ